MYLWNISGTTVLCHKRSTVHLIFKITVSSTTKCADKHGFPWHGHTYSKYVCEHCIVSKNVLVLSVSVCMGIDYLDIFYYIYNQLSRNDCSIRLISRMTVLLQYMYHDEAVE